MSQAESTNANRVDPTTVMRIRNLEVRARVIVEGFLSGLHRSPYHGFSVEFSEYREYSPGDDLRYLDWRLLARTDRSYVKRFEDETNLRCQMVVDLSRSMSYGSLAYSKADYARTLAATLAYFLSLQRDATGVLTFDEGIQDFLPARYRPGHLHRLMVMLERSEGGAATDIRGALDEITRVTIRRGLVILISDMLVDPEPLQRYLSFLRGRGHEVLVTQVLDPAELEFDFQEASIFRDLETNQQLYIDPKVAKRDYLERFEEHQQAVRTTCSNSGAEYLLLRTDTPLDLALFDYLSARMRRKRTPQRHRSV